MKRKGGGGGAERGREGEGACEVFCFWHPAVYG